jgi:ABC-type nickel/cobalt efflux system permease component RcnA
LLVLGRPIGRRGSIVLMVAAAVLVIGVGGWWLMRSEKVRAVPPSGRPLQPSLAT